MEDGGDSSAVEATDKHSDVKGTNYQNRKKKSGKKKERKTRK